MIFFCIFQTLNAFSCDLLVFAINVFKTNIFAFIRTLFLTPTFFLANTNNKFFAHFLCFFSPWLSGFLDYLGLQTALWEILRILCENLWRNKLPKLTTLNPVFQLLHSAVWPILTGVVWCAFLEIRTAQINIKSWEKHQLTPLNCSNPWPKSIH